MAETANPKPLSKTRDSLFSMIKKKVEVEVEVEVEATWLVLDCP
jgi:hypothetical protein